MRCTRCNADISPGKVFCEKCGTPVQIVPDYNALDDELLYSIVEKNNKEYSGNHVPNDGASRDKKKAEKVDAGSAGSDKPNIVRHKIYKKISYNRKRIMAALSVIIVIIAAFSLIAYLNSYGYCMNKGQQSYDSKDYKSAVRYYRKALENDGDESDGYLRLGMAYMSLKQYDKAVESLESALDLDGSSQDVYRYLIQAYLQTGNFDSINSLRASVTDEDIIGIFDEYVVGIPILSVSEGTYDDDITLEIRGQDGLDIYYTVDGSDPTETGNQLKYDEPVLITEGKTTVKAVCKSADHGYSQIITARYDIRYTAPDKPVVNPESGTFMNETYISVEVPEGASVYYTWDGTVPNESSELYVEPIRVIEGNNILSLVTVDRHGMTSDVMECNYKYLP